MRGRWGALVMELVSIKSSSCFITTSSLFTIIVAVGGDFSIDGVVGIDCIDDNEDEVIVSGGGRIGVEGRLGGGGVIVVGGDVGNDGDDDCAVVATI